MARVLMFVTNGVTGDNRVIKEAQALQEAGYTVTLVGKFAEGLQREEAIGGVRVVRIGGDQRYRTGIAARYYKSRDEYTSRYSATVDVVAKWVTGFKGIGPWRIRKVQRKFARFGLAEAAFKSLAVAHKVREVLAAKFYVFRSRMSWKVEPLIYLSDWLHAVEDFAQHEQADIWHAHDLDTLPAALHCRDLYGGKVVYDAHEYWLDCNNTYSRFAYATWALLERRLIGKADAVITVSRSIAKLLAAKYGVATPAVVLNAPNDNGAKHSDLLRKKYQVAPDEFILIYVGLITHERGYEILIRALAKVPRVRLVCLGPGAADYKAGLAVIAESSGVADRLHFMDPVPVAEIQNVAASADAGMVVVQRKAISYELCLPSKFFEYAFSGLPMAVSDLVELRPLVEKYELGVCFDERNADSIAAAIESLLKRRGEFKGPDWEAKRKRVVADYSWDVRKKDLLDVYSGLQAPGISKIKT